MKLNFRIAPLLYVSCFLMIGLSNCTEQNADDSTEFRQEENKSGYSYETLALESGWAYKIYMNEKLFIFQKSIPSIPGNRGFKNQKAAESVAQLVVYKLSNGLMPPSVNKLELDSLGAL